MAASIDVSALDLNAKDIQDMSECLYVTLPTLPEVSKIYSFKSGVKSKQKITVKTNLTKVGIKDTLSTRPSSGAKIALREVIVDPENIGDTIFFKGDEMDRLFQPYTGSISKYTNYFFDNGQANSVVANLTMELSEGMLRALHRHAWWGDKAVAVSTSSLPGLVSASDVQFYNVIDGFWKQIFANVASIDPLLKTPRYTIAKNALLTRAAQTLVAADSIDILDGVIDAAPATLRADPSKILLVTHGVFVAYERYLRGKGVNAEVNITMYGLPSLSYGTIPMIDMGSVWDAPTSLEFEQKNNHAADWLPNRVLLTNPVDLILSSLALSDAKTIESNYEKLLREYWIAFGFTLDAKIGRPTEMVAAY